MGDSKLSNQKIIENSFEYRPNDEELTEELCEFLFDDPDIDASHIDISVRNGLVEIRGVVPNEHMLQLTEERLRDFPGVIRVVNFLTLGSFKSTMGSSL